MHNTTVIKWESELIENLKAKISGNSYWQNRLSSSLLDRELAIHLGVFVEPFLTFIIEGRKTIESRFSAKQCAPYNKVNKGDILLLKKTGGPIIGLCEISQVWLYEIDPGSWAEIRSEFSHALCAQDPEFWKSREVASFATLMRVTRITTIEPLYCAKKDRRGWVVLNP